MRREFLPLLPALTRFTYGAINPLTVDDYTLGELVAYIDAEKAWRAQQTAT